MLGISQSGSTREAITKSEIEEFRIIVPNTNTLKYFERLMKSLFDIKELKAKENQKLGELELLLLSKLVTVEN